MKVFAHRGLKGPKRDENTLAAFEAAVGAGVDGIETDIRRDRDGLPILFHDRCLPEGVPVEALSRQEISERAGYRVATLDEALSQGWDVEWDLEIKTRGGLDAALGCLRRAAGRGRIFVTSFVHELVAEAVASVGVEGGLLIAHAPLDGAPLGPPPPRIPYLVWDFETATAAGLERASQAGFLNMVYGPVTADEHRTAERMRLAAVITDYPCYYRQ